LIGRRGLWLCLAILVFATGSGIVAGVATWWGDESCTSVRFNPAYTATAYVVEVTSADGIGGPRIPIAYCDDDPLRAERVANDLAARYVGDRRLEWRRRAEATHAQFHQATANARRAHAANEARLEALRHAMAAPKTKSANNTAQNDPKKLPLPTVVANPQWLELDRQRTQLELERDRLLIERTALHPAVQEVEIGIEDINRQMLTIPRKIAAAHAVASRNTTVFAVGTTQEPAANHPPSKDLSTDSDRAMLTKLTAEVERSRRAYQKAAAAEARGLGRQDEPCYTLVDAEIVENVENPTTDVLGRWRLIRTSVLASTLMAFGIGMVAAGWRIEPLIGTIAEAEAVARVPVLGVIAADNPLPNPCRQSRRQSHLRRFLLGLGLLLIIACPLVSWAWTVSCAWTLTAVH
jgi:hypothetical protein